MKKSIASRLIEKHKNVPAILSAIESIDRETIPDRPIRWGAELIKGKSVVRCIQFHFQDGSRINFFDNGTFSIVE
jgi:hypothetical protein